MMLNSLSISRLLGRVPGPRRKPERIVTTMQAHGEWWMVIWELNQSLDAFQAAVDWAFNPELSFDLTDACWLNDMISTAMCEGQ